MNDNTNDNNTTMLLRLAIRRIGVDRKVSGDDLREVTGGREVSPEVFRATKKLLACEELDECNRVCNEARAIVGRRAVPAPFIGKGFALMKAERWPLVDEELRAKREELSTCVATLCATLPERIAASQGELSRNGIPWSADEYPSVGEVADGFSISWQPLEFAVPDALRRIDALAWSEAKTRAEREWASAIAECEVLLSEELRALIAHMQERLDDVGGEKKIFRDSLVANLRNFLLEAPFRDVSSSTELAQVCREVAAVLGNETADSLRASPGMRVMVRTGMDSVAARLDQMIARAPGRKLVIGAFGNKNEAITENKEVM